jgi:hypothetical protein
VPHDLTVPINETDFSFLWSGAAFASLRRPGNRRDDKRSAPAKIVREKTSCGECQQQTL